MKALSGSVLFLTFCGLGFAGLWWFRDTLGPWALLLALAWVVVLSKVFAIALAIRGSRR